MAITLSRFAGPLPQDRRILATDISTKVLTQAEAGSYGIEAVQRHVSDEDQKRYFTYDEQTHRFIVKPVLRSLVDFRQLNLQGTYPSVRRWILFFCGTS
jgi:chemotaxis methyl-accepting protein methylase